MYRVIAILILSNTCFSQMNLQMVDSLIENREYEKAEQMAMDWLRQHPSQLEAIEKLGDAYSYQSEWDNAVLQYEKLVELNPENANYNYKYGGALAMKAQSSSKFKALGLVGTIKTAFHRAVALDTSHIDVHWALVDFYVTLPGLLGGSYSKALVYADKLEKLSLVDGYLAKGYVYEYDDEPEKAEYYYKKAVRIGGSITCYAKLSDFYQEQNKPDKAISTLEIAHRKHPRNALHYQIGKVSAEYNMELDKGEKCLKTYLKNHTAKDGVPIEWAYYRLAQIYKHRRDKSNAMFYINKALILKKDFKQAQQEKSEISKL